MNVVLGLIIGILIMLIFNFLRNKKEQLFINVVDIMEVQWIRFNKYFVWLVVNFGFGLIPFFIHLSNDGDLTKNGFLSVVSFAFTLIVSSTYLFSAHIKNLHFDETITILCILFSISLAFLYFIIEVDTPNIVSNYINLKLKYSLYICLALVFLASLFLNMRSIETKVKNAIDQSKLSKNSNDEVDLYKANIK